MKKQTNKEPITAIKKQYHRKKENRNDETSKVTINTERKKTRKNQERKKERHIERKKYRKKDRYTKI